MGERKKKIFLSPFFISISGGLIAYFAGGIINAFASKINLWESLLNLPVKIYHIKIPYFFLVILIIAIFISLVFINKKFQGLSSKKIKEMLADNERITNHNKSIIAVNKELKTEIEKTKEEKKLELNEEHYIILEALASSKDGCDPIEFIYAIFFKKKFKREKGRIDFDLAIIELRRSNLITLGPGVIEDYGESEEKVVCITDSGYACLRDRKDI